jgi:energy-coupling factor transport system ATP-binding protein
MRDPALELHGFSYRYPGAPAPALRDVEISIEPGQLVLLAGRSASGKSTLLRAACGLVPHFHGGDVAGDAAVGGLDLRDHGPAELGGVVGMVAQDPETQVVSATVRGELELPSEMRGEPVPATARAVEEAALALGVAHLLDRSTATLSGGELQRVALAAALVGRPGLVLLDEPTSQLDPVAGDELIGVLRRLNEEWGTTVLLAEHRIERCLAAADRVVAMAEGRIAFDGDPAAYQEWALEADAALATPLARMFEGAGLRPPPVGVKDARARLRALGPAAASGGLPVAESPAPSHSAGGGRPLALRARRAWLALDAGDGPRDVLRDLSLEVHAGELVALMGRNGAGKTTLLRAVAGLAQTSRGSVEAPGGWALVPQAPGDLFVRERVADELPGTAGARALAAAGLASAGDADPRELSGGERQRLALAIALAGRADAFAGQLAAPAGGSLPGLVCLDEPTRGMDTARKHELVRGLRGLAAEGAAVLVATHDVEFAAELAQRVVLLGDGELLADGPAGDVLSGGWYFATEVARALGAAGRVTSDAGARLLRDRLARREGAG